MKRLLLSCVTMVLMLASLQVSAQDRTVSGRVTSAEDGATLPGVSVVLKGTAIGTQTDADGRYSLSIPQAGGTLTFSFIGRKTTEVEVGDRTVIDLPLENDDITLNEVVVTAFGIERSPDQIGYSTQVVKGADMNVAQTTRSAQGLVGKVAGLQINIQNNGVNPTTQVILRGLRSISSGNTALIVIDGIIASQGAYDALNPNDIESQNILKGAAAAAQYGSNAANGALIVVTKRGKPGKLTVGLTSSVTMEQVAYMPDFQTKHGIGWAGNYDRVENTNWGPRFDGVVRPVGPTFADGSSQMLAYAPIQDNLKDFYETGKTYQNTVYFNGGSETGKFYLSLGNQNTTGLVPDDEYKRTTIRVNASQKIGKVELGLNSSYLKDETNVVGSTIGDQNRPLYWFVLNTPANIPLSKYKDWDNPNSYAYADNYYNAYYQNPYWAIGTNRNIDETNRFVANISLTYKITDKISWSNILGTNTVFGKGKNWRARQEYNEDLQPSHSTVSSFVEDSEFQSLDLNGSSIFSGQFKVAQDISLTPRLGVAFIQSDFRSSVIRANNLSIPDFYDISNGTGQLAATVDEEQQREYGIFGEITAGYKDFVYLFLSGRQDFTSTLSKDDNSYFYPAASLSFVASNAIDALKDNNILSYLKVGLSNATVYNDFNPYAINERWAQGAAFPLGSVNGFVLGGQAVDARIQKEKLNTTEITATLGFLNDRLTLDAAYFITKTTNLITATTPSTASASTSFLTNIGELEGKGLELTLGGDVVRAGDFKWRINLNYTTNETVVNEIRDDLKEVAVSNFGGYGIFAIVGKAYPQLKASSYVRDPQGRVVVDPVSGNPIEGDVIAMGKTTPDYILGLFSQMTWKGLSLSATFDYRTGHVYYEQGSDAMEFTGRSIASVSSNRQDFVWPNSVIETSEGVYTPNNNIPITGGVMTFWQNNYNNIKENYVKDATAFKLREVALNYSLPNSILAKTKVINKLSVGVFGRNLWTSLPEENRFSDPEFNNTNSNAIGVGGYFQSPPTRSFGFNLNIEF